MIKYEKSEFVEAIAIELIERLPDLAHIKELNPKIAYMEADHKKKKNSGIVLADCERVKPKMRGFMDYDYVITAYTPNCETLTSNQWKLLIYHELLHIDCSEGEDGKLVCRIRPHNIEEFLEVVDRFGNHWAEQSDVEDILDLVDEDTV